MSRVYDALQKSQGDNPSASPLASPAQAAEASPAETVIPQNDVLQNHAMQAEAPVASPGHSEVSRTAELRTEVLQSAAIATATAPANWLNVPAERVLHPRPTPEQRLVTLVAPNSSGAEMFRVLSTRLAHMQNKRQLRRLLITSSVGEEGKSVVAVNLALTLAQRTGERTLLIEADLRRPTAGSLLTSSSLRGITEWEEGKLALEDCLYQVSGLPLWFLSAGKSMEEPLPLLESDRFAQMLHSVSTPFDWVVLDATPMLPMADSTSLSRLSDGVLVVVREGFTRRKVLNKALETIEPGKMLGVVLNEASMLQVGYERYYDGYDRGSRKLSEVEKVKAVTA
jgi:capsular exopolysaccharide synthesis family protein